MISFTFIMVHWQSVMRLTGRLEVIRLTGRLEVMRGTGRLAVMRT